MANLSQWRFFIDVGGTFTDCLAAGPGGELRSLKVLSSGVFKGLATASSTGRLLQTTGFSSFPKDFFRGYRLALLKGPDKAGGEARVEAFTGGGFVLSEGLEENVPEGTAFEVFSGEEAPMVAIRALLGLRLDEPLDGADLRLGTTVGTNALLQRRGARTALATTQGFQDILSIGTQDRPHLFAREIRRPEMLYGDVVGLAERMSAAGKVLLPLDEEDTRCAFAALRKAGYDSLALCLLHAYRNPLHEEKAARLAREAGFAHISVSHRVSPSIQIVPRGDTTVLDAYLTPTVGQYLDGLTRRLPKGSLRVMTSTGGLVSPPAFSGKESILSGPAGGVVGFARVALEEGIEKAIGFDMGGTSTDVSRFDGRFQYQYETRVAGVRLAMPMLAIETVAAGGGSLCRWDGFTLTVGPASAGADPGPACYGTGGPLTVTDIDLYLGLLAPDLFPFPLDWAAVERNLDALAVEVARDTGKAMTARDLARGFRRIADANMAAPIRRISTTQGYDVREYTLVAFGGAGPQHACAVARLLGLDRILLHPLGGVLSALGIGAAQVRKFAQTPVLAPYTDSAANDLKPVFAAMEKSLLAEVLAEGVGPDRVKPPRRLLEMRFAQEGSTLTVEAGPEHDYAQAFQREHRVLYGHAYEGRDLEVVSARVEMVGEADAAPPVAPARAEGSPRPVRTVEADFGAGLTVVPLFHRADLGPGHELNGPALIADKTGNVVIEPGWSLGVTTLGNLMLRDLAGAGEKESISLSADPVMLEILSNQFAHIAQRMGEVLRRTAFSTNVKERLDFSCAVFDSSGALVANAPHIPVHLGAMGETIRALLAEVADIRPGDTFLTNDPGCGGSHLPDLTVMTPVFDAGDRDIAFFVASRAHHAEMGGRRPGSMAPDSRTLAQEGVLFRNFLLVRDGTLRTRALRSALEGATWPSRRPEENQADLEAQIAANQTGVSDLKGMVEKYGAEAVTAYMGHIREAAGKKMARCLARLPDQTVRFADKLDDGTPVAVTLTKKGGHATVDFTGTGGVHPGNFNAGTGVARAAVLYCFRLLLDEDIPLNEGVLTPIEIILPPGLLNPPVRTRDRAAVAAGNVETSQRVVDVLLGALGIAAASQGTMNNLAFGDDTFSYYETICGGAGAGPGFHGASAVHTHMTNTRLTDPEVLEARYPVRLLRFAIRRGSGGAGRWSGGDGVVREIEFLRSIEVSLITSRRTTAPYGLKGGAPGAPGRNALITDGTLHELKPVCTFRVSPGDRLIIETPGGGGFESRE